MTEHPKKKKKERGVLCYCGHPWGQPNIKKEKKNQLKIKETKDFGVLCCCGHHLHGWDWK
jgi:hypothetical protein